MRMVQDHSYPGIEFSCCNMHLEGEVRSRIFCLLSMGGICTIPSPGLDGVKANLRGPWFAASCAKSGCFKCDDCWVFLVEPLYLETFNVVLKKFSMRNFHWKISRDKFSTLDRKFQVVCRSIKEISKLVFTRTHSVTTSPICVHMNDLDVKRKFFVFLGISIVEWGLSWEMIRELIQSILTNQLWMMLVTGFVDWADNEIRPNKGLVWSSWLGKSESERDCLFWWLDGENVFRSWMEIFVWSL